MKRILSVLLLTILIAPCSWAGSLTIQVTNDNGLPVEGAVATLVPAGVSDATVSGGVKVVTQRNLQFKPFVTLAPVGSTVEFKNEDSVLHHIFSFSKTKRFDLELFGRDEPKSVNFEDSGIVTIGCNIHDGMISHIFVSQTPFAAQSDETGTIKFENIPDSAAELVVWHPLMKQRENRIIRPVNIEELNSTISVSSKFRKGLRRSSDY